MLYTILGNTGKRVSRIGFGGVPAGVKNYVEEYDPQNSDDYDCGLRAVKRAFELGINYFDTAPGYGDGMSERIIGEALDGIQRDRLFLATKVRYAEEPNVFKSLEESLKRLRMDSVDLLQVHGDYYTPELTDELLKDGGMVSQMVRAKEQGLTCHLGITGECQNPEFYRMIDTGMFDVVQVQYNLMFEHPYEPFFKCGSMEYCKRKNMGIVTMRTLTSGIFQKWIQMVNPQNTFDYAPALIQFVLSNPFVNTALLGMRSVEQVEKSVAVCMDEKNRISLDDLHRRKVN